MPSQRLKGLANGKLGGPEKPLMCGLGSKIGLTVESEEGEVPHLRWSQAPPLPWPRPGSADLVDHLCCRRAAEEEKKEEASCLTSVPDRKFQ